MTKFDEYRQTCVASRDGIPTCFRSPACRRGNLELAQAAAAEGVPPVSTPGWPYTPERAPYGLSLEFLAFWRYARPGEPLASRQRQPLTTCATWQVTRAWCARRSLWRCSAGATPI
jgi:hypothetical protein